MPNDCTALRINGQIARPLGDLLAPQFAFFLQLGQRLIDHGQQLQNDGRRDVRHDAQGEDRQAAELAAGEQIDEAQQAASVLLEELLQLVRIDPGVGMCPPRRYTASSPSVNRMRLRRSGIRKMLASFSSIDCKTSNLPPALVIFSWADLENLCACTVSATGQLAIAQHLHRMLALDHARFAQHVGSDGGLAQLGQLLQVHDR